MTRNDIIKAMSFSMECLPFTPCDGNCKNCAEKELAKYDKELISEYLGKLKTMLINVSATKDEITSQSLKAIFDEAVENVEALCKKIGIAI